MSSNRRLEGKIANSPASSFAFVDLFSGIGGFHGALAGLGGHAALAAEIDVNAARVYEDWWKIKPESDVRELARRPELIPDHAVLAGGFPCQPFSKSGHQRGIKEERGTLLHDVIRILKVKRPPVVMLENVRNIAGPRQRDAWNAVVQGLRSAGYLVSSTPLVFSPHLLPPELGGAAQVRERVYIMGVYVGRRTALRQVDAKVALENVPQFGWDPTRWSIEEHVIQHDLDPHTRARFVLSADEVEWIDTWNELLARLGKSARLPGFPMWERAWRSTQRIDAATPPWKRSFLLKNRDFYLMHRQKIDQWRVSNPQIRSFPESRRKLEWQAQDAPRDLWGLLLHLRPSGIRAKKPTYAPALVAMGQTPIFGPGRRRLTPVEAAKLQGFPSDFSFGAQTDALSYKQLGNAVNIGAARYVFCRFVEANAAAVAATGVAGVELVAAADCYLADLGRIRSDVQEFAIGF